MTATTEDIKRWREYAKGLGATHIISVCDTFDHDDYPVYVMPNEDVSVRAAKYNGQNMQRINEIIEI